MTRKAGKFNGNGDFSIGVDFGGTNLRVGSYAGGTDVLDVINLPTRLSEGPERVVRDMGEAILSLSIKDYGDRRFAGAGVGTQDRWNCLRGFCATHPTSPAGITSTSEKRWNRCWASA